MVEQEHALAHPLGWGARQEKYRVPVESKPNEWKLPDEYYALVDGKPSSHNPNFSNPKAVELYADPRYLRKRMSEIPDFYANEVWANHLVLTLETRRKAREVLEQVVKLADTPYAKAHIETMVLLQRSTDAMCDVIEHADATGDFGKAAQMTEPVFEVRDKLNAIYPEFMNPERVNKKDKNQCLTSGMYLQFVEFDKKIKDAKANLVLPSVWKGSLDTEGAAVANEFYQLDANVTALDDLDTTIMPDVSYKTNVNWWHFSTAPK